MPIDYRLETPAFVPKNTNTPTKKRKKRKNTENRIYVDDFEVRRCFRANGVNDTYFTAWDKLSNVIVRLRIFYHEPSRRFSAIKAKKLINIDKIMENMEEAGISDC